MKLRDVYQKLRNEHIVLLRTNGEAHKNLQVKDKENSSMEDEIKVSENDYVWLEITVCVCVCACAF